MDAVATDKYPPRSRLPSVRPQQCNKTEDGIDDLTARTVAQQLLSDTRAAPAPSLVTLMAQRLRAVEVQLVQLRAEVAQKQATIDSLHAQLQSNNANCGGVETDGELRLLRHEVQAMHAFLADYGLEWVGTTPSLELDDAQPHLVDELIAQVERLNAAASSLIVVKAPGESQVHHLTERESLRMVIYRDGLVLKRGPFRPYSDVATQELIQDLLDGYYPFELKEMYPDGVRFDLVDERHSTFATTQSPTYRSLASVGAATMQLPTFLNALPVSVIHKGSIVPIRCEIADLLHPRSSATEARVKTLSPDGVAQLQIRSPDHTVVLQIPHDTTLRDVKAEIAALWGYSPPAFQLASAFPPRTYDNESRTLRDEGLLPRATLHVRFV
ncbi:hypothetical protein SDRG_14124 [Saprolegnia diclina VS20]|uniref:UBX domain-containing protein 11 n=1 Tax=Saprolegnia diclina (strain VS20) TaxID=1156394 RepID=T0R7J3_SAPDV|nr:hypothetical protein SDRG_14124 [Saprolegnia diclina VS20]EQC28028.1 hypothetical protein SDRG_14124 [Saprolegnia diclina VS20]|eukprot:XP_008618453.1 hypothetical protein SDRG_14124 [Saprolegnia diclina VS20]